MRNNVASAAEAAEAHATLTRKTSRDSTRMTLETLPLYLRLPGSRTTEAPAVEKLWTARAKPVEKGRARIFFPAGSRPETHAGARGHRSSRSASLDRSCPRPHDRPLFDLTIR